MIMCIDKDLREEKNKYLKGKLMRVEHVNIDF